MPHDIEMTHFSINVKSDPTLHLQDHVGSGFTFDIRSYNPDFLIDGQPISRHLRLCLMEKAHPWPGDISGRMGLNNPMLDFIPAQSNNLTATKSDQYDLLKLVRQMKTFDLDLSDGRIATMMEGNLIPIPDKALRKLHSIVDEYTMIHHDDTLVNIAE